MLGQMSEISIIHNEALSSALSVDVVDLRYVEPFPNNTASQVIDVENRGNISQSQTPEKVRGGGQHVLRIFKFNLGPDI